MTNIKDYQHLSVAKRKQISDEKRDFCLRNRDVMTRAELAKAVGREVKSINVYLKPTQAEREQKEDIKNKCLILLMNGVKPSVVYRVFPQVPVPTVYAWRRHLKDLELL